MYLYIIMNVCRDINVVDGRRLIRMMTMMMVMILQFGGDLGCLAIACFCDEYYHMAYNVVLLVSSDLPHLVFFPFHS